MLSGYQCEIVAYQCEDGYLCSECARATYGAVSIERVAIGLGAGLPDVSPIIRYELDTYQGELAYEAQLEHPDVTVEILIGHEPCGHCSEALELAEQGYSDSYYRTSCGTCEAAPGESGLEPIFEEETRPHPDNLYPDNDTSSWPSVLCDGCQAELI